MLLKLTPGVNFINILCVFFAKILLPFIFYLFIANFFATQIIGGAKELVVLLWLSGDI